MIISLLESVKYYGHLWPIALLRMFIGYFFFNNGLLMIDKEFLSHPIIQEVLNEWIASGELNPRYISFLQTFVLPHWQPISYLVVGAILAVGVSFMLGFMVRPFSMVAIILSVNFMLAAGNNVIVLNNILIAVNITLFLLSAGRCIGFDYYFYKRVRGLWW